MSTVPTESPDAPVLYDVAENVATITFNRPEAMNSLDHATKESLRDTVRRAAEDPGVRAVLLTGSGRAFCVGQDLKEHAANLATGDPGLARTVTEQYNPTVLTLMSMAKPVVAAVNGVAAGAGASFAFACDLRIMATSAGFNLAFTGIGLSCDTGSSWTLPRLVGSAKARELLLMPRTVGAEESLRLGLATEVVADDDLTARATEVVRRLAAGPTAAYAAVRRALIHSATRPLDESLAYEAEMMQVTGDTHDHRSAVEAFLAKQPPVFHGR